MPFNSNVAKKILGDATDLESGSNCFCISNQVYFHNTQSLDVEQFQIESTVYFNQEIKAFEIKRFVASLEDCESLFSKKKFKTEIAARLFVKENFKTKAQFFKIEKTKLVRCNKKIENKFKHFGKFILLSSQRKHSPREKLQLYRAKDRIEKTFYSIKNEFASKKLRVKTEETLKGKIFLLFITSIIKAQIHTVMTEKELYRKLTFRKLIAQLNKIKLYRLQSKNLLLSEVTKKQTGIFEAFNINPPSTPSVNFSGF
jgi:transposase